MRVRRGLALVLALGIVALLALLIAPPQDKLPPQAVTLVSIEPAGVFDNLGEMSLLTLNLDSPTDPLHFQKALVVRTAEHDVQARVNNHWADVEPIIGWRSFSSTNRECVIVLPAGADSCRLMVHYTWLTRSFKKQPFRGRVEWLAEQFPWCLRRGLSPAFWRWAGFPEYGPSSRWRVLRMEWPLPPRTAPPRRAPASAHSVSFGRSVASLTTLQAPSSLPAMVAVSRESRSSFCFASCRRPEGARTWSSNGQLIEPVVPGPDDVDRLPRKTKKYPL